MALCYPPPPSPLLGWGLFLVGGQVLPRCHSGGTKRNQEVLPEWSSVTTYTRPADGCPSVAACGRAPAVMILGW